MGCGSTEEAIRPLLAPHLRPFLPRAQRKRDPRFIFVVAQAIAANHLKLLPSAVMSSSAPKKEHYNGAWLGSDIYDDHIEELRHCRLLPPASLVAARVSGAENAPTPREGEAVVFEEHFYRGFGLPTSNFFTNFLIFFGMQSHHLAPNAILQLASYVILCEGFLGIEPRLDLWKSCFSSSSSL
ncbi:gypsy-type retrotransposon rire2 protein [Hordeum vulgare]|nr:gypsy-type retrotransposon rire2 protein [Hordeum vulgare]